MTEADEVAIVIYKAAGEPELETMEDARKLAKEHLSSDESHAVIEAVTHALLFL